MRCTSLCLNPARTEMDKAYSAQRIVVATTPTTQWLGVSASVALHWTQRTAPSSGQHGLNRPIVQQYRCSPRWLQPLCVVRLSLSQTVCLLETNVVDKFKRA